MVYRVRQGTHYLPLTFIECKNKHGLPCTWKPIVQTRIDSNKLKKEHKEIYDACKKEVSYRKFSVA